MCLCIRNLISANLGRAAVSGRFSAPPPQSVRKKKERTYKSLELRDFDSGRSDIFIYFYNRFSGRIEGRRAMMIIKENVWLECLES